jgi:hypothetical protein
MTGPDHPEAPPPEVPEEFAAAYREAYRRALEAEGFTADPTRDHAGPGPTELPPQEVVLVGTHRTAEPASSESWVARWRRSRWFVVSVVGAAGAVLVLAAYAAGKALSDEGPEEAAKATRSSQSIEPEASPSPSGGAPVKAKPSHAPGGWTGPVTAVAIDAISADCTAPPSSDSAGHRVTYVPENAADRKSQTAWRCSGTAVGQRLRIRLAADTDIAEVGLLPGYAKTDPESGVDRYAENNRVTRVRWTLGDGVTVVQRLDPDPSSRMVQSVRVPRTTTDTISLEILAVKRGPRNTTAISEVSLAAAS